MHPRFQQSSFWGATLISSRVGLAFAGIQPALALLDTAEQVKHGQNMPNLFLSLFKPFEVRTVRTCSSLWQIQPSGEPIEWISF